MYEIRFESNKKLSFFEFNPRAQPPSPNERIDAVTPPGDRIMNIRIVYAVIGILYLYIPNRDDYK